MAPLHRRLLLLTNWYSRTPNYKNGIWPVFFHLSNFIPLLAIAFIWCLSELILWEETILWAYCTYRPEDLVWEAGPKILFQHKKIKRTYKQSQPNTSPCSCPCACGRGTKSAWSHVRVEAQAFQFPVSYIYCKQLRKPDLSDKRAHEEHTIDLFYEKQKKQKNQLQPKIWHELGHFLRLCTCHKSWLSQGQQHESRVFLRDEFYHLPVN